MQGLIKCLSMFLAMDLTVRDQLHLGQECIRDQEIDQMSIVIWVNKIMVCYLSHLSGHMSCSLLQLCGQFTRFLSFSSFLFIYYHLTYFCKLINLFSNQDNILFLGWSCLPNTRSNKNNCYKQCSVTTQLLWDV